MGVGPHVIQLTRIIHDGEFLKSGFSALELGSPDFVPTLGEARKTILREFCFDREGINTPSDLYRALGCERYEYIDLAGLNGGARKFDLNFDVQAKYAFDDQFDLVTNYGTTEHLLDQRMAFLNVHNLTVAGGVMLHSLPFQGYQSHGMFHYNPSFFLDLAKANDYDVIGLYLSVHDALYPYTEQFLADNDIKRSEDVLVLAALRKRRDLPFKTPFDGGHFVLDGKGKLSRRAEMRSSMRFGIDGDGEEAIDRKDAMLTPTKAAGDPSRPYMFITPVWGEPYVSTFVNITLPSQLSAGNLRAFDKDEIEYVIVTTAHDEQNIRASHSFEQLKEIASVSFIRHRALKGESSYQRQTRAANLALRQVNGETSVFFLTADDFFADGLFGYARGRLIEGARAVIVPTLRANQAGFNAHLRAAGTTTLKPRQLVQAIMRHEHPLLTSVVVNCPSRLWHELPSQTLFRLKDGYLGRWNVMHPLAVKVAPPVPDIESTWDWNYPALMARNTGDIDIIRDSDCGFICSPTEMSYTQDYPILRGATRSRRIRMLVEWVSMNWPLNFHLWQTSEFVRLHAADIGPEWGAAEKELDKVCKPYLAFVKKRAALVPESLRQSSVYLLSRPIVGAPRLVLYRRFARIGLRRIPRVVTDVVRQLLRSVVGLLGRMREPRRTFVVKDQSK